MGDLLRRPVFRKGGASMASNFHRVHGPAMVYHARSPPDILIWARLVAGPRPLRRQGAGRSVQGKLTPTSPKTEPSTFPPITLFLPFTDQMRLAVGRHLARFKGSSPAITPKIDWRCLPWPWCGREWPGPRGARGGAPQPGSCTSGWMQGGPDGSAYNGCHRRFS